MREISETKSPRRLSAALIATTAVVALLGWGYVSSIQRTLELEKNLKEINDEAAAAKSRAIELSLALDSVLQQSKANLDAANKASTAHTTELKAYDLREQRTRERAQELAKMVSTLTAELDESKAKAEALAKAIERAKQEGQNHLPKATPEPQHQTTNPKPVSGKSILLEKFSRVSDDFTRPKVFQHVIFKRRQVNSPKPDESDPEYCFFSLTVDTQGKLAVPVVKNFKYLQILDGDEIVNFRDLESLKRTFHLKFAESTELRLRIHYEYEARFSRYPSIPNFPTHGDLTLGKDEVAAFRETLDLAKYFSENPE